MSGEAELEDDDPSLEQLADSLSQQASQQTPPVTQLPPNVPATQSTTQDTFLSELRTMFNGIPDGMTREEYVAEVVRINEEASEAALLRQQLAELRAQQTAAAIQTQQAAAVPVVQAPVETVEDIPWKPIPVDPAYRMMVQVAPDGSGYAPKNPASPMHISAAQEMNRRAQYEAQLTNALFDNPEDFVGKLTARQMKALEKKVDERIAAFEQQFKPVQEHVAITRQQAETLTFQQKNQDKLFVGEQLSPLGQLTNSLWLNAQDAGAPLAWDTALKIAESSMSAAPVQPVAQSQSISKAGNKRFKETLSAQSRVVNRIEAQEQEHDNPTWKQLEKSFESKFGLKN